MRPRRRRCDGRRVVPGWDRSRPNPPDDARCQWLASLGPLGSRLCHVGQPAGVASFTVLRREWRTRRQEWSGRAGTSEPSVAVLVLLARAAGAGGVARRARVDAVVAPRRGAPAVAV